MRGRVVLAGDADMHKASGNFYGGFGLEPAAVAYAQDAADVAAAIRFARENNIEIAVRSGGHSPAGHSLTNGGLILDVSGMDSMDIDLQARTATVGPGRKAGPYGAEAAKHGLITGFGDTGSVAVSGITLAGGAGFLARSHGLAIDSLLEAHVVTASGELLVASDTENPDLFWAIRGGGGNFGVLTQLTFRLHELTTVTGGTFAMPASAAAIRDFAQASADAPRSLSAIAAVMVAPPMPMIPEHLHGTPVLVAFMCDSGDPVKADEVYRPFRELGAGVTDDIAQIPYMGMFHPGPDAGDAPAPVVAIATAMVDSVDSVADAVMDLLAKPMGVMQVFGFRILGGAVADVPHEATAYSHRDKLIMANAAVMVADPSELPAAQATVDGLIDRLGPDQGAYSGFLGAADATGTERAYTPDTWARLREVKRAYDPDNVFHRNHNVVPAS
jgi:FAD/FMN-containing dehydrogenase